MSTAFLGALMVQAVMIALLRHRLGRGWLRRPVPVLAMVSVFYLGIGPALLAIPSIGRHDTYRLGVQQGYVDLADLIMSAAMLALTLGYLFTRPERVVAVQRPGDAAIAARALDWRLFALACVPLTVITAAGRGYNGGSGSSGPDTSLSTSLVVAFFILVVVVASAGFVMRHGSRWFLPVLIVQSVVLAVAGERTPVVMDTIALILMLRFAGIRVPVRNLVIAIGLTVLFILAISGVRVQQGRGLFYRDSSISTRISALVSGLPAAAGSQSGRDTGGLLTEFAIRVSSVDYGGAILQSVSEGQPRLSPQYVPESLLIAVPSFLWPTKLGHGLALNPGQAQINAFGLQDINFLGGMPGLYMGFLAPQWLVAVFGLLGIVFGRFERWLLRECTPARLVLLGGAVVAALWFEGGLPVMLVQMRSAAVVAVVVYGIKVLRVRAGSAGAPGPRGAPDPAGLPRVTAVRQSRALSR